MTRLLSGVALAGGAVALIWWLSAAALLGVAAIFCALAFVEYARIVRASGGSVPWWPTLIATLLACAIVPFPWITTESLAGVALLVVALAVLSSGRPQEALVTDASMAMLAPIYIGLPLGSLVAVHATAGREAVLLLIATVAVSDTAQYYTGRAFGKTPLAPRHSPKKTREGALGGLMVAPAFLAAAGATWLPTIAPLWLVALGIMLVAAGIAGDLFESMLKRAGQLKDSGSLIPGHGGVLDRIDALLFAAPIYLLFLRIV